jgi:hypothetical protein
LKITHDDLEPVLPDKLPLILGNDLAGTVIAVGRNVVQFKPGDAVDARHNERRIGALAEQIAISQHDAATKPHSLDWNKQRHYPSSFSRPGKPCSTKPTCNRAKGPHPRRFWRCQTIGIQLAIHAIDLYRRGDVVVGVAR